MYNQDSIDERAPMKWDFTKLDDLKRKKEYLEGRDIDWQEISDATHVGISTLWRYRNGNVTNPHLNSVLALCAYFDVPLDYFKVEDADEDGDTPPNRRRPPAFARG